MNNKSYRFGVMFGKDRYFAYGSFDSPERAANWAAMESNGEAFRVVILP